jgi:maltose-binding protein MalE
LGWSAEAIAGLPQRVEQGEFTLFDLVELAQQVKEAGIAPWGLYHHPTGGVDVFQIYLAFGGHLTDETGAQLVLNTAVLKELLQYHHDLVYRWKITPATLVHASAADLNAQHALHSGHLAIRADEAALPSYSADPFLRQATGLLRYARFAPNHTDWPQYEAIVTEVIRAVQARRLAPTEAVQFVTARLRQQLRNQVRIVD